MLIYDESEEEIGFRKGIIIIIIGKSALFEP
jgi:hypothetical protein